MAKKSIEIVIPDAGPLITLAIAESLDLLLAFADDVEIVVTDYVNFEVTSFPDRFIDAGVIADFLKRNSARVRVQETSYGQLAIPAIEAKLGRGEKPNQAFPSDGGELSITSFIQATKTSNPGRPTLVLLEDAWFEENAYAVPGNVHLLSTGSFLVGLEQLKKIPSANAIKERLRTAGRNLAGLAVDKPAEKIPGGTTWKPKIRS